MKKRYQKNYRIKSSELRVIMHNGENLGVLSKGEAMDIAKKEGLDLVVIAENATPPVAKILDFNKFLYDERKKASASKSRSKKSALKEIRFSPGIAEGDLNMKIEKAKKFILGNNKVKATVRLRGRQRAFPKLAFEKMAEFAKGLEEIAKTEDEPELFANTVRVTFVKK